MYIEQFATGIFFCVCVMQKRAWYLLPHLSFTDGEEIQTEEIYKLGGRYMDIVN